MNTYHLLGLAACIAIGYDSFLSNSKVQELSSQYDQIQTRANELIADSDNLRRQITAITHQAADPSAAQTWFQQRLQECPAMLDNPSPRQPAVVRTYSDVTVVALPTPTPVTTSPVKRVWRPADAQFVRPISQAAPYTQPANPTRPSSPSRNPDSFRYSPYSTTTTQP